MPNLFNGGPVDGGTFPAQIWGDYMKAARRGYCGDFAKPDKPFKTVPLKRKDSGGRNGNPVDPQVAPRPAPQPRGTYEEPARPNLPPPPPPRVTPPRPPPPPATGGNGYDPSQYESDPPPAPPPPRSDEQVATPRPDARRRSGTVRQRRCYGCRQLWPRKRSRVRGRVIEALPNAMFRVKLDNEHIVLGPSRARCDAFESASFRVTGCAASCRPTISTARGSSTATASRRPAPSRGRRAIAWTSSTSSRPCASASRRRPRACSSAAATMPRSCGRARCA